MTVSIFEIGKIAVRAFFCEARFRLSRGDNSPEGAYRRLTFTRIHESTPVFTEKKLRTIPKLG